MKIILIQPPISDFYDTDIRLQPLGLCMLKASVKRHIPDVEVIVKDFHQGRGRRTIPYPRELAYLKDYYRYHDKGPFSTFHHFYHFGAGFDEAAEEVAKEMPDIVGISSLFSPFYMDALACANAIKKMINVPVIMGGPHVSAAPRQTLNEPCVDFIIRGEGERPLVEFIKALRSEKAMDSVPNLGFKRNSDMIFNPIEKNYDIRDMAWADFSDLPTDRYMLNRKPLCFIAASRGCPHRCAFCSVHVTFGEGFRTRPIEDVVNEIKKRRHDGYRVFDFEDDNLSLNSEYFKDILKCLISLFPEGDIRLVAMNGMSYLSLDHEMLGLMKRAGFGSLNLSLVSSNKEIMKRYKRPHDLEKYLDIVEISHSLGFNIVTYQILGLPGESIEDMTDTIALLAGLPVLIGVSIFYMTPGSPITGGFPDMTEEDILKARSTAMAIETDSFKRDDIYTLFITARIINYIKGINTDDKDVGISCALDEARGTDKRGVLGTEILNRLLNEKRLYAATGSGMKAVNRFKADLFFRVFQKMTCIRTLKGCRIDLEGLFTS
ncbi:MAG: B12-binding domain-containing radical SAM protein [Deltaproteobacteria bacterium]|nr:B12-binding domain-containing radical SAM protein [Deltaproteobacteria bacterium]